MQHRRTKLNRWVFKWHLKVRMFSHSRISAGRVPGGCSSNRKSAMGQFGVYARNDEHRSIRASEHQKSAEPEVVHGSVRWSGCGPQLVSQYSQ